MRAVALRGQPSSRPRRRVPTAPHPPRNTLNAQPKTPNPKRPTQNAQRKTPYAARARSSAETRAGSFGSTTGAASVGGANSPTKSISVSSR